MNLPDIEEIMETEYSYEFDNIRKAMMVASYYKYGLLKENYGKKCLDSIKAALKDIQEYNDDGNTEHLADAANQLMIEFMCPQNPNAHYKSTDDSGNHVVGMSVNEIERFKEEHSNE
jgi:site-specific recombinase XerD